MTEDRTETCTPAERALLDMVGVWPGVPALVTIDANGNWSCQELDDTFEKSSTSDTMKCGSAARPSELRPQV